MTERVLFLCSGNYFRSRFAEIVFNHEMTERGLDGSADSAGLLMENDNVGNISIHTQSHAGSLGLTVPDRAPQGATAAQFEWATRVIALKESEHRAPIEARFSEFLPKVEFWNVHDEDVRKPSEILPDLHEKVHQLIDRLFP